MGGQQQGPAAPGWHKSADWGAVMKGRVDIPAITVPKVTAAPLFDVAVSPLLPRHNNSAGGPTAERPRGAVGAGVRSPAQTEASPGEMQQDVYGRF